MKKSYLFLVLVMLLSCHEEEEIIEGNPYASDIRILHDNLSVQFYEYVESIEFGVVKQSSAYTRTKSLEAEEIEEIQANLIPSLSRLNLLSRLYSFSGQSRIQMAYRKPLMIWK